MRQNRLFALAFFCAVLGIANFDGANLYADDLFDLSEDELFGSFDEFDSGLDASGEVGAANKVGAANFVDAGTRDPLTVFLGGEDGPGLSGSITSKLSLGWTWVDPWNEDFQLWQADSAAISPDLWARLIVTARPNTSTRFHIATDLAAYPQTDINIFELFADNNLGDHLRLRYGKHTVSWGVGYFFSPADVINLARIDVFDPTAQREGPINLRINIPFGNRHQNIWAYAILPPGKTGGSLEQVLDPADIAYAGKFEMLTGPFELGLGAYWQRNAAPQLALTATGAIKRINLFGELVGSWGSDSYRLDSLAELASYIDTTTTPPSIREKEGLNIKASIGGLYLAMENSLSIIGQYYFNGAGYTGEKRNSLVKEALQFPVFPTQVLGGLLYGMSQHYAAFSVAKTELFTEKLSASLFVIANLSDLSGIIQPSIGWELFEGCEISCMPRFVWATDALWGQGKNSEYVLLAGGPSLSLSFQARLGGGRF